MRRRIPYDPALDGLRAVAVVSVMLYHGAAPIAPGGFLGVDLFFVLSGYLITTLLIREHQASGTVDITGFWQRRIRRLLPALLVMLAWVVVYVRWIDPDAADGGVRDQILATLFYVANWHDITAGTDYFALFSSPSPLIHTWSLAIEEQWYLVWPLAVWGWTRWGGSQRSAAIIATSALALVSAVMMATTLSEVDPSRAYFGTDTRAQALLLGSLLAFVLMGVSGALDPGDRRFAALRRPVVAAVGLVAFAAVAAMVMRVNDTMLWMYKGGFFAFAMMSGLMIGSIRLHPAGLLARALTCRPLPAIGRISYGLYLWHWPIYVLMTPDRIGARGNGLLALRFLATALVAIGSYYLIERPVRNAGSWQRRTHTVALSGLAMASVVAAALIWIPTPSRQDQPTAVRIAADGPVTVAADVMPSPAAPTPLTPLAALTPAPSPTAVAATVAATTGLLPAVPTPTPAPSPTPSPTSVPRGPLVAQGDTVTTLVVGDSVYLDLILGFNGPVRSDALSITADVRLGCGSVRDETNPQCLDRVRSWTTSAEDDRPVLALLGLSKWDVFNVRLDDRWIDFGSAEHTANLLASWEEDVLALSSSGARVVMVSLHCMQGEDNELGAGANLRTDPARTESVNALAKQFVADSALDVVWLDIRQFVCADGVYTAELDGTALHRDGVHYTDAAIPLIWDWLIPQLESIAREP